MNRQLFRLHYGIWFFMAIVFIIGGMLYHGQQDLIREQGIRDGMSAILKDLSMVELSRIRV